MSMIGAKGGGGGTFKNRPDTLRSNDTFEALMGVGAGPMKGPTRGLKSVTVNGTPVEDETGKLNFEDFLVIFADGDPAKFPQIADLRLGGGAAPVAVNVSVTNNTNGSTPGPWVTRTVPNVNADFIDLRFIVSQLFRQDSKGIYETDANLHVEMKPSGSTNWINPMLGDPGQQYSEQGFTEDVYRLYVPFSNYAPNGSWMPETNNGYFKIFGKTNSPAVHELRITVPNQGAYANRGWDIRVRLIERDNLDADPNFEKRTISWESASAGFNTKYGAHEDWRGLAWMQIYGKATDQINATPEIAVVCDTLIVPVPPSNIFNPDTRQYTGALWDGSWTQAYTNDPAWVINGLIVDSLHGLSSVAVGSSLNKWDALEASKWCSQLVPDGAGGTHPRYSMNLALSETLDAKEFVQYLAGAVGGIAWEDTGGEWRIRMDKPENPVDIFTLETIEGDFVYSNTDVDTRFNDITVVFKNEEFDYREDRVRVVSNPHIAKFGRKPTTIVAIGCTNRQEALRRGMLRLRAATREVRSVSFRTNRRGRLLERLDTILVADTELNILLDTEFNTRSTGRIIATAPDRTWIDVRDPLRLELGASYSIKLTRPNPDYNPNATSEPVSPDYDKPTIVETIGLTNNSSQRGDVTRLYLASPLPADVAENANLSLVADGLPALPKAYRVLDIEEDGEFHTISAIELDTGKWDAADNVSEDDTVFIAPDAVVPPPTNLVSYISIFDGERTARQAINLNWDRPASRFLAGFKVDYAVNGGPWISFAERTAINSLELVDPVPGNYQFRVYSVDRRGALSEPAYNNRNVDEIDPGALVGLDKIDIEDGLIWGGAEPFGPDRLDNRLQEWDDVNGDGKPEDNATVGAPANTLVAGVPAGQLVGKVTQVDNDLVDAKNDINDLIATYGNTSSSAANAFAASQAALNSDAARIAAEGARDVAITARDVAGQARDNAQLAQSQAETARNQAQTAQIGAEGARAAAAVEATNALAQAQAAAGSAGTAAGQAQTATTKANEAAGSASAARADSIIARSRSAGNLVGQPTFPIAENLGWGPASNFWEGNPTSKGYTRALRSVQRDNAFGAEIPGDWGGRKIRVVGECWTGESDFGCYMGFRLRLADGSYNWIYTGRLQPRLYYWQQIDSVITFPEGEFVSIVPYLLVDNFEAPATANNTTSFLVSEFFAYDVTEKELALGFANAANTSAGSAATSATQAGTFAGAANTSSISADTSMRAAQQAAISTLPSEFTDPNNWEFDGSWGGSFSISNGVARTFNSAGFNSKGRMAVTPGRFYQVSARYRSVARAGLMYLGARVFNSDDVYLGHYWAPGVAGLGMPPVGQWFVASGEIGSHTGFFDLFPTAAFIRPVLLLGHVDGGDGEATFLKLEDITGAKQADQSAAQAAISRNEAVGAASTAAGHASTAATQVSLATTARNDAQTAAGAANTSRNEASSFASQAGSSASSAATQALSATTAKNAAVAAASRQFVGDFANGFEFWQWAEQAAPTYDFYTGGFGLSGNTLRYTTTTPYSILRTKHPVNSNGVNRRWRITVPLGVFNGEPGVTPADYVYLRAWHLGGVHYTGAVRHWAPGVFNVYPEIEFVTTNSEPFYIDLIVHRFGGPINTHVYGLTATDITEQYNALQAANAASTSAANASASEGVAGQQASAAQTAANNASTAAGQASTFAGQAATSASNAAGSASAATSQAELAASATNAARDLFNSQWPSSLDPEGRQAYNPLSQHAAWEGMHGGGGDGYAWRNFPSDPNSNFYFGHRRPRPTPIGRRFRATTWVWHNRPAGMVYNLYASSGNDASTANANYHGSIVAGGLRTDVPGGVWTKIVSEFVTDSSWAQFFRFQIHIHTPDGQPYNCDWYVKGILIEDITAAHESAQSAAASLSSAQSASASQGAAGASAQAAEASRLAAEAANGSAQGAASVANTRAAEADSSRSAAQAASNLASSFSTQARNSAAATVPSTFENGLQFFTAWWADPVGVRSEFNGTYWTAEQEGGIYFARKRYGTTGGQDISTLGTLPILPNARYRIRVVVRTPSAALPLTFSTFFLGRNQNDSPWNTGAYIFTLGSSEAGAGWGSGWKTVTFEASTADFAANTGGFVRALLRLEPNAGDPDQYWDVRELSIENITQEHSAASSASAASGSATSASGSASSAASSASLSAQYRDQALGHANSAASQASAAASSASQADGHRATAQSNANLAARFATQANRMASGNLVRKPTFEDGTFDGWEVFPTAGGWNGTSPRGYTNGFFLNGRDTLIYSGFGNSIRGEWGNRRLRVQLEGYNAESSYALRAGVFAYGSNGVPLDYPSITVANAGDGWVFGDGEIVLAAGTVAINPWIQIANDTPGGTLRALVTHFALFDVTESKNAESSANAASGSATSASGSASSAASSASLSAQYRDQALGHANSAASQASAAASSASVADGHRASAASQASLAASYATNAVRGASAQGIPSLLTNDDYWFFTEGWADQIAYPEYQGRRYIQTNMPANSLSMLRNRYPMAVRPGMVVRATERVGNWNSDTPNAVHVSRFAWFVDGVRQLDYGTNGAINIPTQWATVDHVNEFTVPANCSELFLETYFEGRAGFVDRRLFLWWTIRLEDVSSEKAAQSSANAASASAATADGHRASAASAASLSASYRDEALGHRNSAQGFANAASGSAAAASASESNTLSYATQASSFGAQALTKNAFFGDPRWTAGAGAGGTPPEYIDWIRDGGSYIGKPVAGPQNPYGAYTLQMDRQGLNVGLRQYLPGQAAGWYVLEADVWVEDGEWRGAGIHYNFENGASGNLHFGTDADINGWSFGGASYQNRKFSKLIHNPSQSPVVNFYIMAAWNGFDGIAYPANVGFARTYWHKALLRPATQQEIEARTALNNAAANAAQISSVNTTLTNAVSALAARTSTVEARADVSGAANLLHNSEFPNGKTNGWFNGGATHGGYTLSVNGAGDYWAPRGEKVLTIHQVGRIGAESYGLWFSENFSVIPGEWLQHYVLFASHRAACEIFVEFWDVNGNFSGQYGGFTGRVYNGDNGGPNPASYARLGVKSYQVPAGCVTARLIMRKYDTNEGQSDSWAWFWRPYVGSARPGQTEWNPYNPGGNRAMTQAVDARVTTTEGAIASIEGAAAFYETVVAASGSNPAIVSLKAGKNGSAINFTGDRIIMRNTVNGETVEVAKFEGGVAQLNSAMIRRLRVAPRSNSSIFLPVMLRPVIRLGSDGQWVQYQNGASFGANPERITPDLNGLPALNVGESYDIRAINITDTGFTAYAKKITAAEPVAVQTGSGVFTGGTPAWRADKPTALDAYNGNYQFTFVVAGSLVASEAGVNDYQAVGQIYITDTAGNFQLVGSYNEYWTTTGGNARAISVTITTSMPVGQNGGYEFGVHPLVGGVNSFTNVVYSTQVQSNVTSLGTAISWIISPPVPD